MFPLWVSHGRVLDFVQISCLWPCADGMLVASCCENSLVYCSCFVKKIIFLSGPFQPLFLTMSIFPYSMIVPEPWRDKVREWGREERQGGEIERQRVQCWYPGFCLNTLRLILQCLTTVMFLCRYTMKFFCPMRVVVINLKIWCKDLPLNENMPFLFPWVCVS